jgi:hypothetical protein
MSMTLHLWITGPRDPLYGQWNAVGARWKADDFRGHCPDWVPETSTLMLRVVFRFEVFAMSLPCIARLPFGAVFDRFSRKCGDEKSCRLKAL